jgi:hypothetical protein
MNSINQLFPNLKNRDFAVYPVAVSFTSTLNAGFYDFDFLPKKKVCELGKNETGLICGINLSSNVSNDLFLEALDENNGFLSIRLIHGENKSDVNLAPFYFCNFSDSSFISNFKIVGSNSSEKESFFIKLGGRIKQIGSINKITLNLIFNLLKTKKDV